MTQRLVLNVKSSDKGSVMEADQAEQLNALLNKFFKRPETKTKKIEETDVLDDTKEMH